MDKNIGFNRNILLPWLDAAAAFSAENHDLTEIRRRLDPVVRHDIASSENRRKAIDILINIWVKSSAVAPDLRAAAVAAFQTTSAQPDRIVLHYGLALVAYPFFRATAAAVGRLGRYEPAMTPAMVKQRLIAERGQLGSLEKAVERIMFSMRNWGILVGTNRRYVYAARQGTLVASTTALESWLLACALRAHPAEELPFADLVRLPELFPFRLRLTLDDLRQQSGFSLHRQGGGLDVVIAK